MAEKSKTISREEGQEIIDKLRSDPEYLAEFLLSPDVVAILEAAIRARSLQKKVSVNDFISAIYIYNNDKAAWYLSDMDNPGAIYGYFQTTIRRYLTDRTFMRNLMGQEIKLENKCDSIDEKDDGRQSLSEKISNDVQDSSAEIAALKIERFKEILGLLYDKSLKFGELIQRTYIDGEKAESIAMDFWQRGLISASDIESAIKNVQNSLLPRARDKFNDIALEKRYDLHLEGKIKKSIIKKIKIH